MDLFLSNVRSLACKLDLLHVYLDNLPSHSIFCVTESWLNDTILDSVLLCNDNFCVFRQDRNFRGGGVAMFVSCKLNSIICPQFTISSASFDAVAIVIKTNNNINDLLICCVYRPPSNVLHDDFITFITNVNNVTSKTVILCGDFNLPAYNWSLFPNNNIPAPYLPFCNSIIQSGFKQIVNFPTRLNNYLDLIFVSDPSLANSCSLKEPFGDLGRESDHCTIHATFNINVNVKANKAPNCKRPNWRKANWDALSAYFQAIDWPSNFSSCITTHDFWAAFMYHFNYATITFVPNIKFGRAYPIFSKATRTLYRRYYRLRAKYYRHPGILLKFCMRNVFRLYKRSRRSDLCLNESKLLRKYNHRSFWSFVRKRIRGAANLSPFTDAKNTLCNDDVSMSNALSQFFSSVFMSKYTGGAAVDLDFSDITNNTMLNFTCADVSAAIIQCKSDCGCGVDGVPNIFLKKLTNVISAPLASIFNISFSSGVLPTDWLCARVSPIPKCTNPSSVTQFRPISITSTVCKVMERIICNSLRDRLLTANFFSNYQFGFLPKRSVDAQLLSCLFDWCKFVDDKVASDVIYLDVKKAFDTVCHSRLLNKLVDLGLGRSLIEWVRGWLCNRTQFVQVGNAKSQVCDVTSGVPQGSILGPLLFLIFINDLPNVVLHSSIRVFADDVKIYRPISNIYDMQLLQSDLISICAWFNANYLSIAVNKCAVLHLNSRYNQNYNYSINGTILPNVTQIRDLGVIIDDNLTFLPHINSIVNKANIRVGILFRAFHKFDHNLLLHMYKVFVRPLLEFACCVWSPHHLQHITLVEAVQRRFTRLLQRGNNPTTYTERCQQYNLQLLYERRNYFDMLLAYKIVNNFTSVPCANLLCINSGRASARRHSYQLIISHSRTDVNRYSFTNRVPHLFNSLLSSTVCNRSLHSFRSALLDDNHFILHNNAVARRLLA